MPNEIYENLTKTWENVYGNTWNGAKPKRSTDAPWITQPTGSQPFNFQNAIQIPAINTGFQTVLSFKVPDGYDGLVDQYSCNFTGGGFINASGDLVWRITQDNKTVKNYESILTERGDPNIPQGIDKLRIYSGRLVQFLVNHANNNLLSNGYIICALAGYFYPNT